MEIERNLISGKPMTCELQPGERIRYRIEKKHVNRDSHVTFLPISQSCFSEEVYRSVLASSQRKLREYIEYFLFEVTKTCNNKKI